MSSHPDFLAGFKALRIAGSMLTGRHFFTENDLGMGHFNPAKHVIHAFDENPAFNRRYVSWRIGDFAAKCSIRRKRSREPDHQYKTKTQHPARHHNYCDAKLPGGVPRLVVILKSKMGNQRLAFKMAQSIFQLHGLNKQVVLRIKTRHSHRRLEIKT